MKFARTLALHDVRLTPGIVAAAGLIALAATLMIALLVPEGRLIQLDLWMLRATRRISPEWWSGVEQLCSMLGGPVVSGLALLAVTAAAALRRRYTLALALLLALVSGSLLELALKFLVETPWFPGNPHWVQLGPRGPWVALEVNGSYPSGHVLRTTYLVLALIAVFPHRAVPVAGFGLVLIGAMVGTRISEHAHWFTDTVGGFTLALATFALALLLAAGLRRLYPWGPAIASIGRGAASNLVSLCRRLPRRIT